VLPDTTFMPRICTPVRPSPNSPNEDLDVAHQLAETIETAELFLYSGDRHLFADSSLPDYDENATAILKQRVLRFLEDLE
jgi:hypothetical protein